MLALSFIVVIVPIIFAFNDYSWNVTDLITPSYSPPKIDFRMEAAGVRVEGKQLHANFRLANFGEVEVVVEGLNATAYGPNGEALAPAMLDEAVVSAPGSTENFTLKVSLSDAAIKRIASYLKERGSVSIGVKGEASIRVFSSHVKAPITAAFEISAVDVAGLVGEDIGVG